MDEHALRRILEGGGGRFGAALRAGLWLPGKLYGFAMALRFAAYRRGWLASVRPPLPLVSVGNLTAGGSGKTPTVMLLARELAARGRRPGILLRGYRPDAAGRSDEEELYRRLCPGIVVRAGKDRLAQAGLARADGADVLLLDDGFQHFRLARNLDLALVDATSPWGGGNCLPGGLLREFPAALARAGVVLITRSDQRDPAFIRELRGEVARLAPKARIFAARHRPIRLYRLGGDELTLEALRGREVAALSGIARPEAFHATLAGLGAKVVLSFVGADHADFGREYVARAIAAADQRGAPLILTEKDAGKNVFAEMADINSGWKKNLWVLGVVQEIDSLPELLEMVEKAIAGG
ncbi:MAG: tetraacyldisaccharide 4'-kinase [Planctomycetota bacterium]|jgi:tetraacyldisaccharide 4'-kinase|nr:tetraacyldisaccharide 4'-kinase [Planctomycetota bacterium]